jgi:hypothetical protein
MVIAGRAVRMDIVDRIDDALVTASQSRSDASIAVNAVVSLLGSSIESAVAVARGLGWKQVPADQSGSAVMVWQPIRTRKRRQRRGPHHDSPFAGLAALASTE